MKNKIKVWDKIQKLKNDKEYLKLRAYYIQHEKLLRNYVKLKRLEE